MTRQRPIDLCNGQPRLDAYTQAAIQNLHAAEMPADIHRQTLRQRLTRQARAAAAERQWPAHFGSNAHSDAHVGWGLRTHHRVRGVQVVGGIHS